MTDQFNRQAIKVSVAQTCQAVGWTSIQTTPMELLTDLVQSYIKRLSRLSSSYANFYGQNEPNLDHVALAFNDMGINVNDLQDYVTYVDNNNVSELPKYPLPKESHLNLLKPGSREVVTRPVHIHEHLPPMHPHLEEETEYPMKASPTSNENSPAEVPANARGVFKRPLDVSQEPVSRKIRLLPEEEIRPLREISSVMMTTSGFLSHAREGKLPETRSIPPIEEDTDDSAQEETTAEREKNAAPVAPVTTDTKPEKKKKNKSGDGGKKVDKENKIKDEPNDSSVRDEEMHKVKKLTGVKETNKLKALKTGAVKLHSSGLNDKKAEKKKKRIASPGAAPVGRPRKSPKIEKPRSPVCREIISASDDQNSVSDIKLPSEPDKQKLNIFKKISKVKEEHEEIKVEVTDDVVSKHNHMHDSVDSSHHSNVNDIIKKHDLDEDSLIFGGRHSPLTTDDLTFIDDPSRPGTPATPKTPDLPRVTEHKKKKKDKHREKKEQDKYISSPRSSKSDEFPAKPKTPEVDITGDDAMTPPFPFYPNVTFPAGPGLIPPPFSHPLIPHMPLMGPYPRIPTPPFTTKHIPQPPKEKEPQPILNIGGIQIPNGITLTPVPPPVSSSQDPISTALSKPSPLKKKDKKDKKNKDKTKKKKDKKDKYKTKEKSEKKKVKLGKKEKDKVKAKKEKKEKKKEKEANEGKKDVSSPALPKITLKLGPASPQDPITENIHRKIVIKPLIKKEEDVDLFSKVTMPESSKSSKKSHHSKKIEPQPDIFKSYGGHSTSQNIDINPYINDVKIEGDPNQVWICPACQRPDDGSPMIACDLCDNWFHWICVGIQEAIDGDWYCRECRIKRDEEAASEKKKKHKKKK